MSTGIPVTITQPKNFILFTYAACQLAMEINMMEKGISSMERERNEIKEWFRIIRIGEL